MFEDVAENHDIECMGRQERMQVDRFDVGLDDWITVPACRRGIRVVGFDTNDVAAAFYEFRREISRAAANVQDIASVGNIIQECGMCPAEPIRT